MALTACAGGPLLTAALPVEPATRPALLLSELIMLRKHRPSLNLFALRYGGRRLLRAPPFFWHEGFI